MVQRVAYAASANSSTLRIFQVLTRSWSSACSDLLHPPLSIPVWPIWRRAEDLHPNPFQGQSAFKAVPVRLSGLLSIKYPYNIRADMQHNTYTSFHGHRVCPTYTDSHVPVLLETSGMTDTYSDHASFSSLHSYLYPQLAEDTGFEPVWLLHRIPFQGSPFGRSGNLPIHWRKSEELTPKVLPSIRFRDGSGTPARFNFQTDAARRVQSGPPSRTQLLYRSQTRSKWRKVGESNSRGCYTARFSKPAQ